jgi:hypothetical protein
MSSPEDIATLVENHNLGRLGCDILLFEKWNTETWEVKYQVQSG